MRVAHPTIVRLKVLSLQLVNQTYKHKTDAELIDGLICTNLPFTQARQPSTSL